MFGCSKSKFKSESFGRKLVARHMANGKYSIERLYIYHCPRCGGWHLTKQPIGRGIEANRPYVPR